MEQLKQAIRDIPDFPKAGIVFKDITPMLSNPETLAQCINAFKDRYAGKGIDTVVGVEARGFIFGAALALSLGCGFTMIRKPGKLPYKTFQETYSLEYGTDTIEIHQDAIQTGQKVLVIDDVLATGGTVNAAASLLKNNFECEILEAAFVMELGFLNGRDKLGGLPVFSLITY